MAQVPTSSSSEAAKKRRVSSGPSVTNTPESQALVGKIRRLIQNSKALTVEEKAPFLEACKPYDQPETKRSARLNRGNCSSHTHQNGQKNTPRK